MSSWITQHDFPSEQMGNSKEREREEFNKTQQLFT